MLRCNLLAACALLAASVSAQTLSNGLNYSTSGPLAIDVSQVDPNLLSTWCDAQRTSCPEICGGRASPNTCDAGTLAYTCTCSNGASPNISDYSQTVPFFVCQQWIANCVDNANGDLDSVTACRSVVCGMKNASSDDETTTSSADASSATTSSSASATDSSPTPSSTTPAATSAAATHTGAAMALHVAESYGTGIITTGLLALFGLML